MRLLIVDLLAERKAFGKEGVREIISHFDNPEVFLWSPHTENRTEYDFGEVVEFPVDCDFIVILRGLGGTSPRGNLGWMMLQN